MTGLYFNVTPADSSKFVVTHDKLKQKHGKADATFDQFNTMLNSKNYSITIPHPLRDLKNEAKEMSLQDEYAKLTYVYIAVNTILIQFNERIKKSFFRVFIEFFCGKKITKINEKGEALIKKCNLEFVKLEEAREKELAAKAEAEKVRQTVVVQPINPPPADGSAPPDENEIKKQLAKSLAREIKAVAEQVKQGQPQLVSPQNTEQSAQPSTPINVSTPENTQPITTTSTSNQDGTTQPTSPSNEPKPENATQTSDITSAPDANPKEQALEVGAPTDPEKIAGKTATLPQQTSNVEPNAPIPQEKVEVTKLVAKLEHKAENDKLAEDARNAQRAEQRKIAAAANKTADQNQTSVGKRMLNYLSTTKVGKFFNMKPTVQALPATPKPENVEEEPSSTKLTLDEFLSTNKKEEYVVPQAQSMQDDKMVDGPKVNNAASPTANNTAAETAAAPKENELGLAYFFGPDNQEPSVDEEDVMDAFLKKAEFEKAKAAQPVVVAIPGKGLTVELPKETDEVIQVKQ